MNLEQLIQFIQPVRKSCSGSPAEAGPLVQDSRKVTPGAVFIAIRGTRYDGHDFLNQAVQNGAAVIICETSYTADTSGVCVLEVENTTRLVGPLAQYFNDNPHLKLKIAGITGTNGKTTTATLVYQVLSASGKKVSLLGTVSKIIGGTAAESSLTTPGPIELAADMKATADSGSEYLIMEVSSHALHQHRVDGIKFDVAAFTNLSHDHLDYHHTMEEYAAAKKMLFDHLSADATAIINADDPYGAYMAEDCRAGKVFVQFNNGNCRLVSNTTAGLVLSVDGHELRTPLLGEFNAYNIAEAFHICKALGLPPEEIKAALKTAGGAPGRMESVAINTQKALPAVIVDYSHTPGALENALSTLKALKTPEQKLAVVFGAGGDRDASKRPEMAEVSERLADSIIVTSDNPRTENPEHIIDDIMAGFKHPAEVTRLASRKEAIFAAIKESSAADIILIAGKGHETYQEINNVRHPFDDRRIAEEALTLKAEGGF